MNKLSKHASLNLSLIQAREALMIQFRPILNQANLSDQQWRVIRLLAENGSLDFQDLVKQTCILAPSLTGILSRLEKSNLLKRKRNKHDQRRVLLSLSKAGEEMYHRIVSQIDARYDAIESALSKDTIEQLHHLLAQLAQLSILPNNTQNDSQPSEQTELS